MQETLSRQKVSQLSHILVVKALLSVYKKLKGSMCLVAINHILNLFNSMSKIYIVLFPIRKQKFIKSTKIRIRI